MARVLGAAAAALVAASIAGQLIVYLTGHDTVYGFVRLSYLDAEQSIPTFFSTAQLLFCALCLAVVAALSHTAGAPDARYWTILAIGFLYMAADEAASIHELLILPLRGLLGGGRRLGIFYFAWVIPYGALVLGLAPFFLRFLFRLPAKTRRAFLTAGGIYLAGAIGMELIEGLYSESRGTRSLTFSMMATVEESLEMTGVIVFIRALLVYAGDHYKAVRVSIDA